MNKAIESGNYKLGLDTGGTYTDAVLLDQNQNIVAHAKSLTTYHDLSIGLRGATSQVLASKSFSGARDSIALVSMSTTLATNALVEGRGRSVCLILIGYSTEQFKRARLSEALGNDPMGFVAGGHNAGGHAACELDMLALENLVNKHKHSVDAFAVSAMFAVRNPEHEIAARDWIREHTEKPVSCGFELSSGLDAPRRALTAVLNARLIPLIKDLLGATASMLTDFSIEAPLMVVKGDGSLVSESFASMSPVETILSGPAASVVGAQFMSGERDLVVSDMGGTTTDIALLKDGVPRLDPDGATVGGWATMVKAVRINTYGLGGDSAVIYDREDCDFTIGPHRVVPLCVFIQQHPGFQKELDHQLELPFSTTHCAQFVFSKRTEGYDPVGLTPQQKELWDRIVKKPFPLQKLFEDQTLERALRKLFDHGHVMLAGFTPTDACLIKNTGLQVAGVAKAETAWSVEAACSGAKLWMRYSEQNLGSTWSDEHVFADMIIRKVSRQASLAILETVLSEQRGHSGRSLPAQQRQLLEELFENTSLSNDSMDPLPNSSSGMSDNSSPVTSDLSPEGSASTSPISSDVELKVRLRSVVMGIGAPAISYYPLVAEMLGTRAEIPEYAGVANALGAVVGTVSQSKTLTITASGGKRVVVHTEAGPKEFEELEAACLWGKTELEREVTQLALDAGGRDIETLFQREDVAVEDQGQKVFFESRLSVRASGRPATAVDT